MVGQNIGKYRVLDRVGRGGMGTVYRAIDETLHREVAIKVLNAELNDDAVARRFRAEAVTVARLNHPGIATVYELFQHEGEWLMVMEFVRGETLEQLVARKGVVPVPEAAELCMQVLGALAHAHSLGVVHRDLKPANLMATESGTVKIMDFGIARVAGTEHLTSAGFMMGTPAYMAPEQVLGQDIDARTDLFAMGVVLYYLTTAKLPFKGETPIQMAQSRIHDQPTPVHQVRPELPPWLGQALNTVLQREPAQRFQTAPIFREALRRGLANLPIETPETTAIPPELVATAAPRSMPVIQSPPVPKEPAGTSVPAPAAVPVPGASPAVVQTAASAAPAAVAPVSVAPTAQAPAAAAASSVSPAPAPAPAAARRAATGGARPPLNVALIGGIAAVVLVVLIGGGLWLHSRGAASTAPPDAGVPVADTSAAPAPVAGTPAVGAPDTGTPAASSLATGEAPAAAADTTSAAETPAASSTTTPASLPPASNAVADNSSAAGNAAGRGASATLPITGATTAGVNAAGAPAAAARGRGAAPTVGSTFDLRLLAFTGKKAEEKSAVLRLAADRLSIVGPNGAALATMPYREITYAVYVHAKDPKWSVVLAAPPPDPDLPGGLFRSSRHWLTLQSRSSFAILHLDDGNWQRVLEALGNRSGVKIDRP
jgi:serine/threonine-protein kinase